MGTGYIRQSAADIVTGNVIEATPLNAEFNQLRDAFHATSGHAHDGTVGEGPKISLATSVSDVLPVAYGGLNAIHKIDATTAPTVNDDSADGYGPGSMWVDVTNDDIYFCVDATAAAAVWLPLDAALDAELSAIAGLASAADRLPYFTGSGTAALATFTSFGRNLVDDADASAARTTLGLVIGTDVLAPDAELTAIAGLTSAADRLPYFTGSGTAALATFTSAGRNLVDDATTADQLTTLGVSAFAQTILDDADAATVRTTIGTVIGTNVQAYDNTLTELAAISGVQGDIIYADGTDSWTRLAKGTASQVLTMNAGATAPEWQSAGGLDADLTALAALASTGFAVRTASNTWAQRSIAVTSSTGLAITDGDGVAGNPTLAGIDASTIVKGVVELATTAEFVTGTDTARALNASQVWGAGDEVTLTDAATIAVDFATGINFVVTLGGNRTLGNPTNVKEGQTGCIRVVQPGAGGPYTLSYGTSWEFAGASAPVASTAANDQDLLFYYAFSSTRIYASMVKDIS